MSETLAHAGWMDFHTRKSLPARLHMEPWFYKSLVSEKSNQRKTQTHRNKHGCEEHLTLLEVSAFLGLSYVAAKDLDRTHFWKQRRDTPLCPLLAYFCPHFSGTLILLSSDWLAGEQFAWIYRSRSTDFPQEWCLHCRWICRRSSASSFPAATGDNDALRVFTLAASGNKRITWSVRAKNSWETGQLAYWYHEDYRKAFFERSHMNKIIIIRGKRPGEMFFLIIGKRLFKLKNRYLLNDGTYQVDQLLVNKMVVIWSLFDAPTAKTHTIYSFLYVHFHKIISINIILYCYGPAPAIESTLKI